MIQLYDMCCCFQFEYCQPETSYVNKEIRNLNLPFVLHDNSNLLRLTEIIFDEWCTMHMKIVNHHIELIYLFYIECSVMQKCVFSLNNAGTKI